MKCATPGEDGRHARNSSAGGSLACHIRSATICRSWHLGHLALRTSDPRSYTWPESIWRRSGRCERSPSLSDCGPTQPVRQSVIHHSLSYSSLSAHPGGGYRGKDKGDASPSASVSVAGRLTCPHNSERSGPRPVSSPSDNFGFAAVCHLSCDDCLHDKVEH